MFILVAFSSLFKHELGVHKDCFDTGKFGVLRMDAPTNLKTLHGVDFEDLMDY